MYLLKVRKSKLTPFDEKLCYIGETESMPCKQNKMCTHSDQFHVKLNKKSTGQFFNLIFPANPSELSWQSFTLI